jgi:hypothetical protein
MDDRLTVIPTFWCIGCAPYYFPRLTGALHYTNWGLAGLLRSSSMICDESSAGPITYAVATRLNFSDGAPLLTFQQLSILTIFSLQRCPPLWHQGFCLTPPHSPTSSNTFSAQPYQYHPLLQRGYLNSSYALYRFLPLS